MEKWRQQPFPCNKIPWLVLKVVVLKHSCRKVGVSGRHWVKQVLGTVQSSQGRIPWCERNRIAQKHRSKYIVAIISFMRIFCSDKFNENWESPRGWFETFCPHVDQSNLRGKKQSDFSAGFFPSGKFKGEGDEGARPFLENDFYEGLAVCRRVQ